MDRDVTIRFYQIEHLQEFGDQFSDIVDEIERLAKVDREREVSATIYLRKQHGFAIRKSTGRC